MMDGSNLTDKKGVLLNIFITNFLLYIKMSENTDLTDNQKTRDVMLNKGKDYYKNNKDRLRDQARDKYSNLFKEEKNKKREYRKNRYRNMSEENKQRLKEKLSRDKKVLI